MSCSLIKQQLCQQKNKIYDLLQAVIWLHTTLGVPNLVQDISEA